MKKVYNNFLSLELKLRVIIIFVISVIVLGVTAFASLTINNPKNIEEIACLVEDEIKDDWFKIVEKAPEEELPAEEPEEEVVQEVVKYKDKEIEVKKAPVSTKDDGQKQKTGGDAVSAEQAVQQFENEGQSVGIDVSYHNGTINWGAVRDSGIEFAMIRVGYRGNSIGVITEDVQFKRNISEAIKHGIKVGIYFYSTAISEQEALEEAAWVVSVIKTYAITYPVVYDFEDFGRYRCGGVDGAVATRNAVAFLDYVANAGYTPMMYACKNDINTRFSKSALSKYKFWLAHYTSRTDYAGSYHMWQYTSSGSVPGIARKCRYECCIF